MSDSFVDLLLVRLGREEEKKKVMKLLITNLDLSVKEAEDAVSNSPSVIKEAVSMNEARIIQKDMYPYIDLLPRLEEEPVNESSDSIPQPAVNEPELSETVVPEDDIANEFEEHDDVDIDVEVDNNIDDDDDDDPIIITSASEEIVSATRCHICGRTPSDDQRLAPCRTCGDLTCRDCFDRVAHVCNHCANKGKTVDKANEGMESESETGLEFDTDEVTQDIVNKKSGVVRSILVVLFIVVLAGLFYFIDPMGLFSGNQLAGFFQSEEVSAVVDTTSVDSVFIQDSILSDTTATLEITGDSTEITPDSISTSVDLVIDVDPYGVLSLSTSDSLISEEDVLSINYQTRRPRSLSEVIIPSEESEILFEQVSVIASAIPVMVDDGVFLVYQDTTSILVLAILHPVEMDTRMELMRNVAAMLIQTEIDQLVIVYKEDRFQQVNHFSLVQESFSSVQGILNPRQFQGFLSTRVNCWELISGPVTQWLSSE